MKRAAMLLMSAVLAGLLGYLGVEAFIPAEKEALPQAKTQPAAVSFPLVTRLDIARDYGYFIGDVIPLTLVVEARKEVVVDLVNLPRQGEQHGLFEVRDVTITSAVRADEVTTYRAAYHLQYFGAAPLAIKFAPLEILYAQASDRNTVTQTYRYKSLFSQPVTINIARIGPYQPTEALDPKGPLTDRRPALFWTAGIFGMICLMAAAGGWGRSWWHHYCRQHDPAPNTIAEKALQRLRRNETLLTSEERHGVAVATQLSRIMRDYLQDTWGVSAYALTPTELAARLNGNPQVHDVLGLLQRCDACKYEAGKADENEVDFLWDEAVTLFEQLD